MEASSINAVCAMESIIATLKQRLSSFCDQYGQGVPTGRYDPNRFLAAGKARETQWMEDNVFSFLS